MKGGDNIIAHRVEQHVIRKTDSIWKTIDENCLLSKNLYNYANYILRQEYISSGNWIHYRELDNMLHGSDPYKQLMSQPAQQTLAALDKMWKSFFMATKDWNKNPTKYFGMPRLPNYKPKDGRYPWFIKNNSCRIRDGTLSFLIKRLHGVSFHTSAKGRLQCVRFIPRGTCYVMEIVTEVDTPDIPDRPMKRIAGIDLGVNNFATIANNIGAPPIIINGKGLKSINQFYNKRKAKMRSMLMKRNGKGVSQSIMDLGFKRFCRVKSFMHIASKRVVTYCIENNIDTLVCGLNKEWKNETNIGKRNNQQFCFIPHDMFIRQLTYKCQDAGIRFLTQEESFTSGTSFLDGEPPIKDFYDKSRRIKRGLFQSSLGLINSDVNGAMQIIRKVSENAFEGYSVGVDRLQPVILNLV